MLYKLCVIWCLVKRIAGTVHRDAFEEGNAGTV